MRVQQDAPALADQVWAGQVTLKAALRQLDGEDNAALKRQRQAVQSEVSALFRRAPEQPELVERLLAFLKELNR